MRSLLDLLLPRRASGHAPSRRRPFAPERHFRPLLESLEDRTVLSTTSVASHAVMGPALTSPAVSAVQQALSLLPITINSVSNVSGSLVANASAGNTNFQVPLTL